MVALRGAPTTSPDLYEHLARKGAGADPFHVLWRHPDNASFTEQGE
jgi:hypothetical protein